LATFSSTAMAATKKKSIATETAVAAVKIYVPIVNLVCKPCANVSQAPSSTTSPSDVCCEYVVVGWQELIK
jgi:hypothetical protein